MPKKVAPLSSTQIKNVRARDREFNLADGDGLYLRVKPSGTKTWIFNYRVPFTSRRSNLSFGAYPVISLADARREREACRKLLAKEVDPKTARAERETSLRRAHHNTLQSVAEEWFKLKSHEITSDYAADVWNSLENHVFPKLGAKPVHKLVARDIIEVLSPLQDQGKLELVKRICQRLNMVMDHAVVVGLLEENRITRISRAFKSPRKQHLPTLRPEELPDLLKAIENADIYSVTRLLILWQLHTMTRPAEAAGARWEEIDWDRSIWTIPTVRMKKRRDHAIPLTTQTVGLLEELKTYSAHREHLFPSYRQPRRPMNSATANMALRRMGYQNRLVSHGLRSIASTTLYENEFESDLVETALAHLDKNQTRAAYNRSDFLERRREMMNWWSGHIEQAGQTTE